MLYTDAGDLQARAASRLIHAYIRSLLSRRSCGHRQSPTLLIALCRRKTCPVFAAISGQRPAQVACTLTWIVRKAADIERDRQKAPRQTGRRTEQVEKFSGAERLSASIENDVSGPIRSDPVPLTGALTHPSCYSTRGIPRRWLAGGVQSSS